MIEENAGEELLRSIGKVAEDLRTAQFAIVRLKEEPPLGMTPAAQVYRPFLASIAGDPVQGGAAVLAKLLEELEGLRELVQQAINDYRTTEQTNEDGFDRQASSLPS